MSLEHVDTRLNPLLFKELWRYAIDGGASFFEIRPHGSRSTDARARVRDFDYSWRGDLYGSERFAKQMYTGSRFLVWSIVD